MRESEVAIRAAKIAGEIIRKNFGGFVTVSAKHGNPKDTVTNIDHQAERAIITILKDYFPKYSIHSEESGMEQGKSSKQWVIDPLDSTTNFTRLVPCSSISIGLVNRSQTELGIVYLPFTDELYVAERGKGTTLNGELIKVSGTESIDRAFASVEWYSRSPEFQKKGIEIFSAFAYKVAKIRYLSATIFEIVRVASGQFDFMVCDTHYLDTVAAGLIVTEAGGQITDQQGNPIKPGSSEVVKIVASNRRLHNQVLALIRPN